VASLVTNWGLAGWRVDSYRQILCRLSHTFLWYRPFRLSTLDSRLRWPRCATFLTCIAGWVGV
jgi:hypothetical protein